MLPPSSGLKNTSVNQPATHDSEEGIAFIFRAKNMSRKKVTKKQTAPCLLRHLLFDPEDGGMVNLHRITRHRFAEDSKSTALIIAVFSLLIFGLFNIDSQNSLAQL
jgi:hypothetical protein